MPKRRASSAPRRGRPRVHQEPWLKVSVVLFARQVRALDRLTRSTRRADGKPMTRAEVIRALVDALISSRVRLNLHASEAALGDYIARRLGSGRGRGSRARRS
jgi:hypothetical protein